MPRRRDTGWAIAWVKGSEVAFAFSVADLSHAESEWLGGQAFTRVTDCWGDPLTLKLGEVVAMGSVTPQGHRQWQEEMRLERTEDRQADMLEGA